MEVKTDFEYRFKWANVTMKVSDSYDKDPLQ